MNRASCKAVAARRVPHRRHSDQRPSRPQTRLRPRRCSRPGLSRRWAHCPQQLPPPSGHKSTCRRCTAPGPSRRMMDLQSLLVQIGLELLAPGATVALGVDALWPARQDACQLRQSSRRQGSRTTAALILDTACGVAFRRCVWSAPHTLQFVRRQWSGCCRCACSHWLHRRRHGRAHGVRLWRR